MAKLRGRDALKARDVREQLEALNTHFDGPGGVALLKYEPRRAGHRVGLSGR